MFVSTSVYDATLEQYTTILRTGNYGYLMHDYTGEPLQSKKSEDLKAIFDSIENEFTQSLLDQHNIKLSKMRDIVELDAKINVLTKCLEAYNLYGGFKSEDFTALFKELGVMIKLTKKEQLKELDLTLKGLHNRLNRECGLLEREKVKNKNVTSSLEEQIVDVGLCFEPALQLSMDLSLYQYSVYVKRANDRIKQIKKAHLKLQSKKNKR